MKTPSQGGATCAQCDFENPPAMKFCGGCGWQLPRGCPSCDFTNPPGFKFCGDCGAKLSEHRCARIQSSPVEDTPAAEVLPPAKTRLKTEVEPATGRSSKEPIRAPSDDVERRQITVMFADLVGSTQLSSDMDPEDLRDVVRAYQTTASSIIERYDGYIAQYLGDGILVYFGYPTAHEDDAMRAVGAGWEIVSAVSELDARLALSHGVQLQVRLGVHTGLVVVGEVGGGDRKENLALGQTPNLAARIGAVAKPGRMVISDTTARLVASQLELESLGPHELKGIGGPTQLHSVAGLGAADDRFDVVSRQEITPLIGRVRELEQLVQLWKRSTSGQGQVVLLEGEAGVGKSRIISALRNELVHEGHSLLWARGLALNEGTTFSPIVEMLERICGIQHADSVAERFRKLETALLENGLSGAKEVSLMADLLELPTPVMYPTLDLTPVKRKHSTIEVVVALLGRLSEKEPVLLIIEDLHWIDSSTQELLDRVVIEGPTRPMFIVVTSRPRSEQPSWVGKSYVARIVLTPLPSSDVESMVLRVTNGKRLPKEVLMQIVAKTDGVPLFVEELTKMVLESGGLIESKGDYELAGPLNSLTIPTSLQDSLNARLDALNHGKAVAQIASTIEREFVYALAAAVWPGAEDDLRAGLDELVRVEFVYQRGTPPRSSYIFKHALVQDASAESMTRKRLRGINVAIAVVLENLHHYTSKKGGPTSLPDSGLSALAEVVETTPERIAHHYTRGGNAEKAIDWWMIAVQRSIQRSANREVIEHLSTALKLLKPLEKSKDNQLREFEIQGMLGGALAGAVGYAAPEVQSAFKRALEIARLIGDDHRVFQAELGLWMFNVVRADFPEALRGAQALSALARKHEDPSYIVEAGFAEGCTAFFIGRPREAIVYLETAVRADSHDRDRSISQLSGQDAAVNSHVYIAMASWMLGDSDRAMAAAQTAIELADAVQHSYSWVYAQHFSSWIYAWMRDWKHAESHSDRCIKKSVEMGYFWVTLSNIIRGRVRVEQGRTGEAMELMTGGLKAFRGGGARLSQTFQLALLGEACLARGALCEGLAYVEEGLLAVSETNEGFWTAELHRVKGELLAGKDSEAAEVEFREALAIADAQGNVAHALKAAISLGRLLEPLGRVDEGVIRTVRRARADLRDPRRALADVHDAETWLSRHEENSRGGSLLSSTPLQPSSS